MAGKRGNRKLICAFCGATEGDDPSVIFAPSGYEGLAICSNCLKQGYTALCADQAAGAAVKEKKDRKSTRLNSSHLKLSRMPSSA